MEENKALDWVEKCAESEGRMTLLPAELREEHDKFAEEFKENEKIIKEFNKKQAILQYHGREYWYKVREALDKLGYDNVWEKSVGWNEQAKKEGFIVINLFDNPGQRPLDQ
jgi:hypothetical protein